MSADDLKRVLDDRREGYTMPSPTPELLADPRFDAIWETIKSWDINVPQYYGGYCAANGSHVVLILNALSKATGA